MNHPPLRHVPRQANEADLQPIWDAYPSDRVRDRAACRCHLASALSEAAHDELVAAAKVYSVETANYTRRTVMFLDNWLRTGKWRRYVQYHRQHRMDAAERAKANEETMIGNAARWISERSDMCRHVPQRYAVAAIDRGPITLQQAKASGVMS